MLWKRWFAEKEPPGQVSGWKEGIHQSTTFYCACVFIDAALYLRRLEMTIIKNHLQIELTIDAIIYRLRLHRILEDNRQLHPSQPDPETDMITNILMRSLDDDRDRRAVDRPNANLSPTEVSRYIDGIRSSRSTPNIPMAIQDKKTPLINKQFQPRSSSRDRLTLAMTKTDGRFDKYLRWEICGRLVSCLSK